LGESLLLAASCDEGAYFSGIHMKPPISKIYGFRVTDA